MSIVSRFGLNLPERKLILLTLIDKDNEGEKGVDILHMNKIIKHHQENMSKNEVEFSNYNLGAVSYEVEETIQILEENDLIYSKNNKYYLTSLGEEAIKILIEKTSKEELNSMRESKILLNDLGFNELLFYMYYKFPDTQEYSTQIKRLKIMKKGIINKLIKKEKIDLRTADSWLLRRT